MRTQRGAAWAARCQFGIRGSGFTRRDGLFARHAVPQPGEPECCQRVHGLVRQSPLAVNSVPLRLPKNYLSPRRRLRRRASNLSGGCAFRVRLEWLLRQPKAMENDGEFSRHRHNRFALPALPATLR